MKKRILSLFLCVSLALSLVPTAVFATDGSDSDTTAPAADATVYVTIADGEGKLVLTQEKVTVTDTDYDGSLTINDALYAAHEAKYEGGAEAGYASEQKENISGLSLTKLWGIENGSGYGYYVNNGSANSLSDEVKEGDYVDAFIYTDLTAWSDTYCYFDQRTATGTAGDSLTLTLSAAGYDASWNPITVPVESATITIDGTATVTTTDSEGKATITLPDTAGEYVISATSESQTLVPPVCVVTVSVAEGDDGEGGDGDAEAPVLTNLSLYNASFTEPSTFDGSTTAYAVTGTASGGTVSVTPSYDKEKQTLTYSYNGGAIQTFDETGYAYFDVAVTYGTSVLTVTLTDDATLAATTYTLTITRPIPTSTDNSIDTIYTPFKATYGSSWPYSEAVIYQANESGEKQESTTITNEYKYYYAELPADTSSFYFTAYAQDYTYAKIRYSINDGDWQDNANALTPNAKIKFQIISGNAYYTSPEGWDGKEVNTFTVWVKCAEEPAPTLQLSGEGTEASPYLLTDADDFANLDAMVEAGNTYADTYFKVTADVTLPADWNGIGKGKVEIVESWGSLIPTTKEFIPFSGIFDGNGKTITFESGAQPLFDCVRNAEIKNVNISGAYIADDGLIANYATDNGPDGTSGTADDWTAKISNVTILSGTKIAGSGLLGGYARGTNTVDISNVTVESGVTVGCNADGNSLNASNIGGIAGDFNGTITNSTCAATVYGEDFVGGIVGGKGQSMGTFTISNCAFTGTVVATGNYVGGIAGSGYTGSGWGFTNNAGVPTITNCYVSGNVTGSDYVGGILGAEPGVVQVWENVAGSITDNVFYGTLTATEDGAYKGGIIGYLKSLNRYQTISNNYWLSTQADKGIGGVLYVDTNCTSPTAVDGTTYVNSETSKTGITGMSKTGCNRTDDPLGTDAAGLACAVSATALTDGTVVKYLNESATSSKNWTKGDNGPVHSDADFVYMLTMSGTVPTQTVGSALDLTGVTFTASWSKSEPTTLTVGTGDDNVKVTGYNSSVYGTQTLTATYQGVSCTFHVYVLKPVEESKPTTITVYFTLKGDSKHDSDADGKVHTLKKNNLTTWLARKAYTVDQNATIWDLLESIDNANDSVEFDDGSDNYVDSITYNGVKLAEFTNGKKSGWQYTLNGTHPEYGVAEQYLENGDEIVFHYTDDYTNEEGAASWGGGTATETPEETPETSVSVTPSVTVNASGEATAEVSGSAITGALEEASKDDTVGTITIAPQVSGEATAVTVELPKSAAADVADAGLDLTVETGIANVTIPTEALSELASETGSTVSVSAESNDDGSVTIDVAVDGESIPEVSGGLSITVPVEETTAGTVLLLVDADGTETILAKSISNGNEIAALVDGSCTVKVVDNAKDFSDTQDHWGESAVDFVAARELYNGVGGGRFDPDGTMTRAMLVTVLHRLEGSPDSTGDSGFQDVAEGQWYAESIAWGASIGLVTGVGNNTFLPDDELSREQIATILHRYAQYLTMPTDQSGDLSQFTDHEDTSDWALEGKAWAVGAGIISGKPGGTLDPTGDATRAEVATMLQRMVTLIVG